MLNECNISMNAPEGSITVRGLRASKLAQTGFELVGRPRLVCGCKTRQNLCPQCEMMHTEECRKLVCGKA
jgi:hypothetical protein